MVEINNEMIKLNQVICVGYLNSRRNYEITSGRLYDYDKNYIYLDVSYDFTSLNEVVKAKIEDIKYCKVTIDNMYR